MSNPVALKAALDAAESRRAEAAAQLERRMAAMEAVLASRHAAADASLVAVASREPSTALGDVLSSHRAPPWDSTIERLIDKPRPSPWSLVV